MRSQFLWDKISFENLISCLMNEFEFFFNLKWDKAIKLHLESFYSGNNKPELSDM